MGSVPIGLLETRLGLFRPSDGSLRTLPVHQNPFRDEVVLTEIDVFVLIDFCVGSIQ